MHYKNQQSLDTMNQKYTGIKDMSVTKKIRFVDLCAGLGGFHHAISRLQNELAKTTSFSINFECALACEIDNELREIYAKNFPSIIKSYEQLYPHTTNQELYNEKHQFERIHGDIADLLDGEKLKKHTGSDREFIIPEHDLLCAGFPCQPFSKSGSQKGFDDVRGTVFGMLKVIIETHLPAMVLLENVGNFERHDEGNTWGTVQSVLEGLGYTVIATTHKTSGQNSQGLLSPHHIGLPHHRERFFITASLPEKMARLGLTPNSNPFPKRFGRAKKDQQLAKSLDNISGTRLKKILQESELAASEKELAQTKISETSEKCITLWNELLTKIEEFNQTTSFNGKIALPSFPIWGYELDPWSWYPYETNPKELKENNEQLAEAWLSKNTLASTFIAPPPHLSQLEGVTSEQQSELVKLWVDSWPAYAKKRTKWPRWKFRFIDQNREFAKQLLTNMDSTWLRNWLNNLALFSPSMQKLEWNCKGEQPTLYGNILQFRPSGLRVKRLCHVPALVAMTTTQNPIVPIQCDKTKNILEHSQVRYLMPREALQLQGLPYDWIIPHKKDDAYKAFGNAVHAELVQEVLKQWLLTEHTETKKILHRQLAS